MARNFLIKKVNLEIAVYADFVNPPDEAICSVAGKDKGRI